MSEEREREPAEVLADDLFRVNRGMLLIVAEWMLDKGWTEPLESEPRTNDWMAGYGAGQRDAGRVAASPLPDDGLRAALEAIEHAATVIEDADRRAEAADGPVNHVRDELTDREWTTLYRAIKDARDRLRAALSATPSAQPEGLERLDGLAEPSDSVLLAYLWTATGKDPNVRVRDLFADDDPLTDDIERRLQRLTSAALVAETPEEK